VEDKMILQLTASKVKKPMPDLKILSYDIETAKDPLKFPDA
jgi:DNA polymerase elongation subunit (family B)